MTNNNKKVEEANEALGINEAMTEEEEFDLVAGFLKAAEMNEITKNVEIRRAGTPLLKFRVHPVTTADLKAAKKKASTYIPNPNNKKLPPIVKEVDSAKYESYLIYLATVAEDKEKLWESAAFKNRFNVMEGYELVDKVLLPGEKDGVVDVINEISGYGNDDDSDIETAKNS